MVVDLQHVICFLRLVGLAFYVPFVGNWQCRLFLRATNLPIRKTQEILVDCFYGDQHRLALFF